MLAAYAMAQEPLEFAVVATSQRGTATVTEIKMTPSEFAAEAARLTPMQTASVMMLTTVSEPSTSAACAMAQEPLEIAGVATFQRVTATATETS